MPRQLNKEEIQHSSCLKLNFSDIRTNKHRLEKQDNRSTAKLKMDLGHRSMSKKTLCDNISITDNMKHMDLISRSIAFSQVTCPFCERRFNKRAAERHIPICESLSKNKPNPKDKNNSKKDDRRVHSS